MLLLFENTLIHYIYIVFYTLISWAHPAYNLGNFYAMSRHTTPAATSSPRSKQLHAMSNHTPNDIRAHNNRHAITNDADNLHNMSNHTPERHPVRTPRPQHHYTAGLPHIDKPNLTASIPMGNSAAEAFFRSRFVQNHKLL